MGGDTKMKFLYQGDNTGIKLLSEDELQGGYPDWFSDHDVHRYNTHWSRPQSRKDIIKFVEGLHLDKSKIVFSVYSIQDNKHIGNISLQNINHQHQSAEMAFLFGEKAYWGKGYATEASKIIIEHGFKFLNLNRIYLGCLAANIGMITLAEKLSFRKEGERRQAIFSEGTFLDVWEYGLLKHEY